MSPLEKTLLGVNFILYGFLAVFSYAYVDLNLTLSQNPLALNFIGTLQQLGYFHRPQATLTYLVLVIFAFSFFIVNLWLFYNKKIGLGYLKITTVTNTLILVFAYPFLSSDLFNYLFDAKIILQYHLSPYTHRALDFPGDEWIRFMRWIHRYSPYGPLWLGASLIPAALGFGKFILNFFTFKIFIAAFHLANTYLIYKILEKTDPKIILFGTSFYALNPLFLIEGVANAHNDMVLATFLILPIYFLTKGKILAPYASLAVGALVKYISILNLPWFLLHTFLPKARQIKRLILANLATMAVFTFIYSSFGITAPFVSSGATQVQFQPWYLFWTLPFIALVPRIAFAAVAIALSVGAALRYLPYIYYGDWSTPGTTGFMWAATVIPPTAIVLILSVKNVIRIKKN